MCACVFGKGAATFSSAVVVCTGKREMRLPGSGGTCILFQRRAASDAVPWSSKKVGTLCFAYRDRCMCVEDGGETILFN